MHLTIRDGTDPMHDQSITIPRAVGATATHAAAHHGGRRGWLRFGLHFVEMVAAMVIGMGVLTALLGMPHESPVEIQALFMAATMTIPMVAWMLVRGHSRRGSAEMALTMVVPLAILFPLSAARVISGDALLDLQHVLMLPAMLLAMLVRRGEYGL